MAQGTGRREYCTSGIDDGGGRERRRRHVRSFALPLRADDGTVPTKRDQNTSDTTTEKRFGSCFVAFEVTLRCSDASLRCTRRDGEVISSGKQQHFNVRAGWGSPIDIQHKEPIPIKLNCAQGRTKTCSSVSFTQSTSVTA